MIGLITDGRTGQDIAAEIILLQPQVQMQIAFCLEQNQDGLNSPRCPQEYLPNSLIPRPQGLWGARRLWWVQLELDLA